MTAYRATFTAADADELTGHRATIFEWADDESSETIVHEDILVTGYGAAWLTAVGPDGQPLRIFFDSICDVTREAA